MKHLQHHSSLLLHLHVEPLQHVFGSYKDVATNEQESFPYFQPHPTSQLGIDQENTLFTATLLNGSAKSYKAHSPSSWKSLIPNMLLWFATATHCLTWKYSTIVHSTLLFESTAGFISAPLGSNLKNNSWWRCGYSVWPNCMGSSYRDIGSAEHLRHSHVHLLQKLKNIAVAVFFNDIHCPILHFSFYHITARKHLNTVIV